MHKNDFKLVSVNWIKRGLTISFSLYSDKKRHESNLEELSQVTDDWQELLFFSFIFFYKIHSAFGDVKIHLLNIPSGSVLKYSENGLTDCSGNKKEKQIKKLSINAKQRSVSIYCRKRIPKWHFKVLDNIHASSAIFSWGNNSFGCFQYVKVNIWLMLKFSDRYRLGSSDPVTLKFIPSPGKGDLMRGENQLIYQRSPSMWRRLSKTPRL